MPADFLGLSGETANTCELSTLYQTSPAFVQLFRNLGSGVLRIGGNTVESVTWQPDQTTTSACAWDDTTMTEPLVDSVFDFAESVGWKVVWTLPLQHADPDQSTAQADYVASEGSTLQSLEFGNEPNLYGNASQAMADWESEVSSFRDTDTTTAITGPAAAIPYKPYVAPFLSTYHADISALTVHAYFGPASDTDPKTIRDLLSTSMAQRGETDISAALGLGEQYGLPVFMNETGSYVNYGQAGVSNSLASALWASDYLFDGLEAGLSGMYFHGVPNYQPGNTRGQPEVYSPLNADNTPAPLYYGLLLFHCATQGGGTVVPVQLSASTNVTAHAIKGTDGTLRVVIINKDMSQAARTTIEVPGYDSGTMIRLQGPQLSSTSGITLGGAAVDPTTGVWAPTAAGQIAVPVKNGSARVTVPFGRAVEITFS